MLRIPACDLTFKLVATVSVSLLITACGGGGGGSNSSPTVPPPPPAAVMSVEVSPEIMTLFVPDRGSVSAIARAADGTVLNGRTIVWSSLNSAVATVSGTGEIAAVAPGTATIRGDSRRAAGGGSHVGFPRSAW